MNGIRKKQVDAAKLFKAGGHPESASQKKVVDQKVDFYYKPQFIRNEIHKKGQRKSITKPGDVLMNIVGPPLGKIAVVPDDFAEWNINQAITLFRPKDHLNNKFLYYFFCEGTLIRDIINETRGMVGQSNISLSQCRNFEIDIPPLAEQKEIVRRIERLFAVADHIEASYKTLQEKIDQLPQSILSKAFRGELVAHETEKELGKYGNR